nr:immunoglobulin light chain junction region [Macaca mulatta]MOX85598.1 immunoglobulin light chain junction region [Macaca mulatta]MOX86057.1 immunoglobulin light chain junction region [Macaca mulatta]MOX86078.1 immunoglobulin light chain junction region [Macaca mulatta]MOX86093.1 immunoglobulin light chain junction region [Macaca mulatta]
CQQGNDNPLTF